MSPASTPEEVKRRIFLVLLPLAGLVSLGLGVHGILTARVTDWAAWAGIGTGALLLAFMVVFRYVRGGSKWAEWALVVVAASVMAGTMIYGAIEHDENVATFELIRQGTWLPVIYGVAFLVLSPRTGALVAWTLWGFLAITSSSHLLNPKGHTAAEITTIAETLIANAVVVLVLSGVARVIRANERRAAGLEVAANTDALTHLANRRGGERRLEDEVERSIRYDRPLSVVLFDLDLFKRVNDSFGHDVGDEVLRKVPEALAGRIRESDLLVRWGGEEFLVIAPEMNLDQATAMAERFRSLVEDHEFGVAWPMTASFGVAQRTGVESGADVVRRADEAMYAAKRHGRNAVWRSAVTRAGHQVEHVTSGAPTRTSDRLPPVKIQEPSSRTARGAHSSATTVSARDATARDATTRSATTGDADADDDPQLLR